MKRWLLSLFGYVGEVSEEELEELKQQDPNTPL